MSQNRDVTRRSWDGCSMLIGMMALLVAAVSAATGLYAVRQAQEALDEAARANQLAEQANQIALGSERLAPRLVLSADSEEKRVEWMSVGDILEEAIELSAWNAGETYVDAVRVDFHGIESLSHGPDHREEFELTDTSWLVELPEFLNPEGVVYLDISAMMVTLLDDIANSLAVQDDVYRVTYNVRLFGRQENDVIPRVIDVEQRNDIVVLTIFFVPSAVMEVSDSLDEKALTIEARTIP